MIAGQLNRRCLIEKRSVTQDAQFGSEVITWVKVAEVWCEVRDVLPSRSTEKPVLSLKVETQKTRIRMRWRTDLNTTMRLTINRPPLSIYQIIGGPAEIGNREYIEYIAEEFSV